jgi:hypothetical protein
VACPLAAGPDRIPRSAAGLAGRVRRH